MPYNYTTWLITFKEVIVKADEDSVLLKSWCGTQNRMQYRRSVNINAENGLLDQYVNKRIND